MKPPEPVHVVKRRREGLLRSLVDGVPYIRFLGVEFDRRGDELTAVLPFSDSLIGNPAGRSGSFDPSGRSRRWPGPMPGAADRWLVAHVWGWPAPAKLRPGCASPGSRGGAMTKSEPECAADLGRQPVELP